MSPQPNSSTDAQALAAPLELPCGITLNNRIVKAAMSDSLGDGTGRASDDQIELYRRWANGGVALAMIGEVQVDHRFPENPGNLVLDPDSDDDQLQLLAEAGSVNGAHLWPQLGHAGALSYGPLSSPTGPSSLDLDELRCDEFSAADLGALPQVYARAAAQAQRAGFSGVQIHAGHGFLLSQFLSPLFNHRTDRFGGSIEARTQLLLDIIGAVRTEVGTSFAIGVRINSSDQLEGGLTEDDSLTAIGLVGELAVDLIDISGGTYFPGAPSSSDRRSSGPYFVDFARRARAVTDTPLMVTGGFKTRSEAAAAITSGAADAVGLARTLALDPELAQHWLGAGGDPAFPRFDSPPEGGVTAWFTMRLAAIARGDEEMFAPTLDEAISSYHARDATRLEPWRTRFANGSTPSCRR